MYFPFFWTHLKYNEQLAPSWGEWSDLWSEHFINIFIDGVHWLYIVHCTMILVSSWLWQTQKGWITERFKQTQQQTVRCLHYSVTIFWIYLFTQYLNSDNLDCNKVITHLEKTWFMLVKMIQLIYFMAFSEACHPCYSSHTLLQVAQTPSWPPRDCSQTNTS